ncbi:MAG: virulence-associated protein E [Clostridiales bacterium]|nr:virulence-associated protein E [Clostridiales bacterium]
MTHDREIIISTAGSRQATTWLSQPTSWAGFVQRLSQPIRGQESFGEYMALTKAQQDGRKDVGGFVGGTLRGERRRKGEVLTRDLITLDMDSLPPDGLAQLRHQLAALGCAWAVYSTRKHEAHKPRLRVIIPLLAAIPAQQYEPAARMVAKQLGMHWCDPTTFQPERLMYWPSACRGAEYIFETADLPLLDGALVLAAYPGDWQDAALWPRVPGGADTAPMTADTFAKTADKRPDPRDKPGIVGAFCRAYTVPEAMAAFLPGVYLPDPSDSSRYTYAQGSTAGGAMLYDQGRYLFSYHASDPVCNQGVNAFDLVRLHRFAGFDKESQPNTPVNRLPSYIKMRLLAMSLPEVKKDIWSRKETENREKHGLPEPAAGAGEADWMGRLEVGDKGIINSPGNAQIVLKFDPLLAGRLYRNSFSGAVWARLPLPWDPRKGEGEDIRWTDADRSCLRIYLMARTGNGVRGRDSMDDALMAYTAANAVNPVLDYLTQEPWDGTARLDTLFVDYLGAPDTPYTRKVARIMLMGAAARASGDKPVKFDTMCVLTGRQGVGKSTFIRKLAINDLYTDGIYDFNGKNAAEIVQGKIFVEVPELSALYRSDINRVKSFLSQEADDYRVAYGRVVEMHPRRCVFFGTSNDYEYLSDPTGNRRFLPIDVMVNAPTKSIWDDLEGEKQQIWAEAWMRLQQGEPLYLMGDEAKEATHQQELHNTENAREGVIRAFLDKAVPAKWPAMDLYARKNWLGGEEANGWSKQDAAAPRDRVCAQEVYQECLGGELRLMKQTDAREINRIIRMTGHWEDARGVNFGYCGKVRGFIRKKTSVL